MTTRKTGGRAVQEVVEPYRLLTADEFFEWSDGTDTRYELVDGMLHAQAATTRDHGRIVTTIFEAFIGPAREARCEVQVGSAGVRISDSTIYIPDISVICDPSDTSTRYIELPCLIVEVLSPSTEQVDRREKVVAYHGLQSLLTYLVVHQEHRRIERHWRDDEASPWQLLTYTGGTIPLPCLNTDLAIEDVYRNVAAGNLEEQTS